MYEELITEVCEELDKSLAASLEKGLDITNSANFIFKEKVVHKLMESGVDIDLSFEIVGSIHVDLPNDSLTAQNFDDLVESISKILFSLFESLKTQEKAILPYIKLLFSDITVKIT